MMDQHTYLQSKLAGLLHLYEVSKSDPILRIQLEGRIKEARSELHEFENDGTFFPKENLPVPRVAVFVSGDSVIGTEAIKASLAGDVLNGYARLYRAQCKLEERGNWSKQKKTRSTNWYDLMLTSTPRGSFGFELTPDVDKGNPEGLLMCCNAIDKVNKSIESVVLSEDKISEIRVPDSLLPALKSFLDPLHKNNAELRITSTQSQSIRVTSSQIGSALLKLEKMITEETVTKIGTFSGVLKNSGMFELKLNTSEVIRGLVEDLSDESLDRLHNLVDKFCEFVLIETTITRVTGTAKSYVLVDAKETQLLQ